MMDDKSSPSQPQQQIIAEDGSIISNVTQTIYTRSQKEELDDYLARAVADFEGRMLQHLRPPASGDEPYKFLYAFEIEDRDIFFGREAAVQELLEKVLDNRLTVVHSRSGAGKTSLLNAGLSPRLIEAGYLPVYVRTRAYEEKLTLAVKQSIARPSLGLWPDLLPNLSLHEFLGLVCAELSHQTKGLIVIFDQFEEFLVSLADPNVRLPFIKTLSDSYEDRLLPVRFIISLRRENLWDLDEFQDLIPHIIENRYALPFMTEDEVVEAITKPILHLKKGVSFEESLLKTLLNDLGQEEVKLPHLQIVCTKLYDALPKEEKIITLALYQSFEGTTGLLAHYLNDTLSQLPRRKQKTARNVLKELVNSTATPRILGLAALTEQLSPDPALLEDVLDRLVDARLLRLEEATVEKEYELAHAYLAEEIIDWIDQDGLRVKEAQELLKGELVNWRVHQTLVNEKRLEILRRFIKHLSLDSEAQTLLFHSALKEGYDVGFWFEQSADKEAAIEQTAKHLVENGRLRKKMAADLESSIKQRWRNLLLTRLWTIFDNTKGADRRNIARTLWVFKSWLPIGGLLQVIGVLGPVWMVQVLLPFTVVLVMLFLCGSKLGVYVFRECAISGRWTSIPAGSFMMGVDQKEAEAAYDYCLTGAKNPEKCSTPEELLSWSQRQMDAWLPEFEIMDNEVTKAQYKHCIDEAICQDSKWVYDVSDANKPVTNVSWIKAMTYCQEWLGGRLPMEGEWEKAARGPDDTYFPWGNDWDASKANLEHHDDGSSEAITVYAETDTNKYKVKNMAGNVREWTASGGLCYDLAYGETFHNNILKTDEIGQQDICAVVRGGSWKNPRNIGMASARLGISPSDQREEHGFRCVCPIVGTCRTPWGVPWVWFGDY